MKSFGWQLWTVCLAFAGAARASDAPAAGALLASGRLAEAEQLARSCADPRCKLVLARSLFAQGRAADAAEALRGSGEELGPLLPRALLLRAESLLIAGAPAEAAAQLEKVPGDGPVRLRAATLLADALLALGRATEAREQAQRAEALSGQAPEVRASLAWVAAQAAALQATADVGRAEEAARAMRGFWLAHPSHPAAEMARERERALARLPDPAPRELLSRAQRLLSAGRPGAAAAQAKAAADRLRGEDAAEAHLFEARALAADGRRGDAVKLVEDAWLHGNAHVSAQGGLLYARDRARRGKDEEALRILEKLFRRHPSEVEVEEGQLLAARLELDLGRKDRARARLAKVAATRKGPNASAARWQLAWLSFRDGLPDAAERFAEFAASSTTDPDRAQGIYWQARAEKPQTAAGLFRRAADLDPLGWYGLLASTRLGSLSSTPAPFPPPRRPEPDRPLPPRLALAAELASLGLLGEAAAEADFFVQQDAPRAIDALPLYERVGRYERSVTIAESLLLRGKDPATLAAAYPAAYPDQVQRSARRTRVDPYLLLSIMRRESLFKPDVRSAAGAVGLLQLLPATARRAALVLGRPPLRDEQLVEPDVAIDLGAWYLADLIGRFGDAVVAAAAYNAGPRIAAPWASRGAGKPIDEWVEDIPYRETRRYVKTVIGAWSAYRILAGGSPPAVAETVPTPASGVEF